MSKVEKEYTVACAHCGKKSNLYLIVNRNKNARITGLAFFCNRCEGEVYIVSKSRDCGWRKVNDGGK